MNDDNCFSFSDELFLTPHVKSTALNTPELNEVSRAIKHVVFCQADLKVLALVS